MPDQAHAIPEGAPSREASRDALSKRAAELHASAEARSRPASPADVLRAFELTFAERGSVAPAHIRESVEKTTDALRALIEGGDADGEDAASLALELRRKEVTVDLFHASRRVLPEFFRSYGPRELATALRAGVRHPRYLAEVALMQSVDLRDDRPASSPEKILLEGLPKSLRPSYELLVSDIVPQWFAEDAEQIANQLLNRAYPEALARLDRMLESWANPPEELGSLSSRLVERERDSRERETELFRLQNELYDAVLASHPERREAIEGRRRTEEIFRHGRLVGDLVALIPSENHSGAPFKVTLEHMGETRVAVVKFGFAERFARDGVQPGNGHFREVAGAAHAFAFGLDAPAVVARRTEGFGEATIMELLDGGSCDREDGWWLGSSGELRPEIGTMALEEYLKFRTDGAPRNNVLTADGRIVPIDHGSDMPADRDSAMGSVALFLASDSGLSVPEELQERVRAWKDSRELAVFKEMVAQFPEDMDAYLSAYDSRLGELVEMFELVPNPAYPRYRLIDHMDFGKRFLAERAELSRARHPAPAANDTVPIPRAL